MIVYFKNMCESKIMPTMDFIKIEIYFSEWTFVLLLIIINKYYRKTGT